MRLLAIILTILGCTGVLQAAQSQVFGGAGAPPVDTGAIVQTAVAAAADSAASTYVPLAGATTTGPIIPPSFSLAQASQIPASGKAGARLWITDLADGANAVYSDGQAWVRENTKGVQSIALTGTDTMPDLLTGAPTLLVTSGLGVVGTKNLVLPSSPRPGAYRRVIRSSTAGTLGTLNIGAIVGGSMTTLMSGLAVGSTGEFMADGNGVWQRLN